MTNTRHRILLFTFVVPAACDPSVPQNPTWSDVEPILAGACTGCHGATADRNGKSSDLGMVYRFDFYSVTPDVCGDAAQALGTELMGVGSAQLIAGSVTPPSSGGQARMPPSPGPALEDWERDTLLRWAAQGFPPLVPLRGSQPPGNRLPQVTLSTLDLRPVGDALDFDALIADPDGESAIGVLKLGAETVKLTGPGSFHVHVSTASWAPGRYPASAVLCDGWGNASYVLPDIVKDAP